MRERSRRTGGVRRALISMLSISRATTGLLGSSIPGFNPPWLGNLTIPRDQSHLLWWTDRVLQLLGMDASRCLTPVKPNEMCDPCPLHREDRYLEICGDTNEPISRLGYPPILFFVVDENRLGSYLSIKIIEYFLAEVFIKIWVLKAEGFDFE